MNDKIKLQNALNFVRSELSSAKNPKMDKYIDVERVLFLEKLIKILT